MCIVLENRDFKYTYDINNINLCSLDYLRNIYVSYLISQGVNLKPYGNNWDEFKGEKDTRPTYEIMSEHTFVLIIENTNADGYVSEKIYDAWVAGCIPIYYGNINDNYNISNNMYINLKNYTPETLYSFLLTLTISDIYNYMDNIIKNREDILTFASSKTYGELIKKFIHFI
jgi:hypothetical protein